MTKSISVGELRQNPTAALNDVAAGESYEVTKHNQVIARLVPATGVIAASGPSDLDNTLPSSSAAETATRRGATLDRVRNSPLYRRKRPRSLVEKMLDNIEEGRHRMGEIGQ